MDVVVECASSVRDECDELVLDGLGCFELIDGHVQLCSLIASLDSLLAHQTEGPRASRCEDHAEQADEHAQKPSPPSNTLSACQLKKTAAPVTTAEARTVQPL